MTVWAKLESANPGGSSKDRSALRLIEDAMASGRLERGGTVIESTSGNLGVGLAQACKRLGVNLVCVVDSRTHPINLKTLGAFGADVRVVDEADAAGRSLLEARLELVRELSAGTPGSYWPNQYENLSSVAAHRDGTMREIDEAMGGVVDHLFVATSTTGTLRGCCEYLDQHRRETRVVAVDAEGSALFGGVAGERKLPGHGAGTPTPLSLNAWFDHLERVRDLEAVVGCRRLLEAEAILAGASSGAVATALDRHLDTMEPGSRCALILADGGAGYLDTVYSDEWVEKATGVTPAELEALVAGGRPDVGVAV